MRSHHEAENDDSLSVVAIKALLRIIELSSEETIMGLQVRAG